MKESEKGERIRGKVEREGEARETQDEEDERAKERDLTSSRPPNEGS